MFAILPYDDYTALVEQATGHADKLPDTAVMLPHEVVKRSTLGNVSLIRAWREYLQLSQAEVATRMGIAQPSYAKMEAKSTQNRQSTLKRIAEALGLQWEQLEE